MSGVALPLALLYVMIGCIVASAFLGSPQAEVLLGERPIERNYNKTQTALAHLVAIVLAVTLWLPIGVVAVMRASRRGPM